MLACECVNVLVCGCVGNDADVYMDVCVCGVCVRVCSCVSVCMCLCYCVGVWLDGCVSV